MWIRLSRSRSVVSGVAYWIFGYAFAFGKGNQFIGYTHFASHELPDTEYATFFFQYTFAATAATIVSGFIYPVVTHWLWGGGFLFTGVDYEGDIGVIGYQDFAGSGIVHVLGGTSAFVGAALLGPRIGRFHRQTKTVMQLRGHSVPIAALGGFILFFGFLAFNGGSQLAISNEGDGAAVSLAVVNTIISASFAAFSSLVINRSPLFGNKSWSLLITINGALTGMALFLVSPSTCGRGSSGIHYGGGSWGVIALAFLHKEQGILMNWDQRSGLVFAWQLAGLAVITAWAGLMSLLMFGTLRLFKALRVPEDIEVRGLDIPKHNEPAYPVEAYGHGHIEKILQMLDKAGPVKVTQAFERLNSGDGQTNFGYADVADGGCYESPEVRHALAHMATNGTSGTENSNTVRPAHAEVKM
ncbi:AMT1-like protein [Mya arenaria]|uniref:AMT1-like protein n=1 Tax=Mya arenaria TaxID=6604 RepID=A0ABY7DXA9_MYAAR|nr:AMT1-like protein [Mya arenaria]